MSVDSPRFLADENLEPSILRGMLLREPTIDIVTAPAAGTLGLKDPPLLAAAAEMNRILVSFDKRTLPGHFADFLVSGRHSPGIILLARKASIGRLIDALLLVWGASSHDEWRDTITRLPF